MLNNTYNNFNKKIPLYNRKMNLTKQIWHKFKKNMIINLKKWKNKT